MTKLFEIFFSFFKIGAFTIGGGYAMIPLIEREVVDNKKWIEQDEFSEMLALAQIAPGPIAINTAVFVGYKLNKKLGSVVACLGASLPSFIIILIIAFFFSKTFQTNPIVQKVFQGIRPVVIALIAVPAINMLLKFKDNYLAWIIAMLSFSIMVFTNISPIYVMVACGIFGYLYYRFNKRSTKQ